MRWTRHPMAAPCSTLRARALQNGSLSFLTVAPQQNRTPRHGTHRCASPPASLTHNRLLVDCALAFVSVRVPCSRSDREALCIFTAHVVVAPARLRTDCPRRRSTRRLAAATSTVSRSFSPPVPTSPPAPRQAPPAPHAGASSESLNSSLGTALEKSSDSGLASPPRAQTGGTPLHWAALEQRLDCTEALLLAGADCNAAASDGATALHEAAAACAASCVRALQAAGADPNALAAVREWTCQRLGLALLRPSLWNAAGGLSQLVRGGCPLSGRRVRPTRGCG